jgi:hypothetical protein
VRERARVRAAQLDMQSAEIVPQQLIESKILFIRGKKVMPDRDLAALYGVETKMLNRAVKRNTERFPEDFMFQLSKEEYTELLRCQFGTLERGRYSKSRKRIGFLWDKDE